MTELDINYMFLQDGDYGLCSGELRPKPQGQQHHEEQDGPQRGDWHPGYSFGVRYESQPSS